MAASLAVPACHQAGNPAPAAFHEWRAAIFVWAALPPTSRKNASVCRQLLELRGHLGAAAALTAQEVAHG